MSESLDGIHSTLVDLEAPTATDIAKDVVNGYKSAERNVKRALARAHEVNGQLGAFTELYDEEALARARELDQRVSAGEDVGSLAGVPFAVKDFTPLRGKRTTLGSLVYADVCGEFDPVYVRRLVAAGAIVIGKTNTPEFAGTSFCQNRLFGVTRNPWDPERTPGGSSGGAAVAVASGCVPIAEGTDMGGSVRIPAAWSGVVGLKPSLGRIPMDIIPSQFDTISHFGPLAKTVEDAWRFLSATAGPAQEDPFSLPSQHIALNPNSGVENLSIALSPDLGCYSVDDAVVDNLNRAADRLRASGAQVIEVQFEWEANIYRDIVDHWCWTLAAWHGDLLEEYREWLDSEIVEQIERGYELEAVPAKRFEFTRSRVWKDVNALLQQYEALICPTVAMAAPSVECRESDFGHKESNGRVRAVELAAPFNMTAHCPALSVPSGVDREGMPQAVQVIGRRFDEEMVLRVAREVERRSSLKGAAAA